MSLFIASNLAKSLAWYPNLIVRRLRRDHLKDISVGLDI